jgi:hypothetical protein
VRELEEKLRGKEKLVGEKDVALLEAVNAKQSLTEKCKSA